MATGELATNEAPFDRTAPAGYELAAPRLVLGEFLSSGRQARTWPMARRGFKAFRVSSSPIQCRSARCCYPSIGRGVSERMMASDETYSFMVLQLRGRKQRHAPNMIQARIRGLSNLLHSLYKIPAPT